MLQVSGVVPAVLGCILGVAGISVAGAATQPHLLVATMGTLAPVAVQDISLLRPSTADAPQRHSSLTWKAKVREQVLEIDPRRRYGPAEVAATLNCSYDTAIRRMRRMPGTRNLGTKEGRFRRGKAMLRILGSDLLAYLDDHKLP